MRRGVWLLGGLVLLLGGAHFAYWRVATTQLRSGYAAWVAGQREAGWTVSNGKPAVGGWPLAATLTLPEVFIAGAAPVPIDGLAGALTWSTDHLILRVSLLRPGSLGVLSTGLQRLRLGEYAEIPYTADALRLDIPLDPAAPPHSAELLANDLRIGLPLPAGPAASEAAAEADAVAGLTIGLLKGHLELLPADPPGVSAVAFQLAGEAASLPPRAIAPITAALGTRLSSLSIVGSFAGLPPAPTAGEARARPADPPAQARAWRDRGGSLRIGRLALGWGPLGLSVTATLGLDQDLQPSGTGSARIVGFTRTLDALAASHAIGAQAALAAKALLGLIARPAGQTDIVELPLTLQDRMLSVRQMPLVRLPAWEWN